MDRSTEFLTTGKVAKLLGMTPEAVRQRCKKGIVIGARQDHPGSHWRIPVSYVREVLSGLTPRRRG